MNHYIIAKFKPTVSKDRICEELPKIQAIFEDAKTIPGIHAVEFHRNCIDLPNRYDLMIKIVMEPEALAAWSECDSHKKWKSEYGPLLEAKCIFDCEDSIG